MKRREIRLLIGFMIGGVLGNMLFKCCSADELDSLIKENLRLQIEIKKVELKKNNLWNIQ